MTKNTVYIIPIEPIDQRYTKQWFDFIPEYIKNNTNLNVVNIEGCSIEDKTTTGAFLDFGATNAYKASQVEIIAKLFTAGEVKPNSHFLITDAWNFIITAIRYMSELLDIPVKIHGIWHAGNYDPTDILGMKMTGDWASNQERAWFYACDYNYFATDFHKEKFLKNLNIDFRQKHKAVRCGQPHGKIIEFMNSLPSSEKEDIIIWPHRYNEDKQPEIAEDISKHFNVIITQKMNFNKEQYYKIMKKSKVVFSCALHENLGISVMEGVLADVIPLLPDRCSYSEMYFKDFIYPSDWTLSYDEYIENKNKILDKISFMLSNYENMKSLLHIQQKILKDKYLRATELLINLK